MYSGVLFFFSVYVAFLHKFTEIKTLAVWSAAYFLLIDYYSWVFFEEAQDMVPGPTFVQLTLCSLML